MNTISNTQHAHQKLLDELRVVIDNATMMLAYTEQHTSAQCLEARERLTMTLDQAKNELSALERVQTIDAGNVAPRAERAKSAFSGENAIFNAFR